LPDAGHLQEKDAEYANRHKFSKHKPALPLYTEQDAWAALEHLTPVSFDEEQALPGAARLRFRQMGHILGAASVQIDWGGTTVVFSGDVGRYGDATMVDPFGRSRPTISWWSHLWQSADESDPGDAFAEVISDTIGRGGTVVIPALRCRTRSKHFISPTRPEIGGQLTNVPVFLDSPMAVDASEIFCRYIKDHKLSEAECRGSCAVAEYVRSVEDSKALNANPMPKVIISASGMATGGRVLHHLKRYAPDPKSTILFAGFQAGGTRGASMVSGAESIKIHGEYVPLRAQVKNLEMLSAHADADEILRWLRGFKAAPKMTYLVHGEPTASDVLRHRIEEELGWPCRVPDLGEKVELT
jgi:metallo-beta-lactamase family protein